MSHVKLICVVPVYNEAAILPQSIPLLHAALSNKLGKDFQIVIANNGSTDNTAKISEELVKQYGTTIVHHLVPQKGRGNAFRIVFSNMTADNYMYIDADLPCHLSDLSQHIDQLSTGADLVVSKRTGPRPLGRKIMTIGLRSLNYLFFGVKVSDSQCAVKALSKNAAKILTDSCEQTGWFLDTELVIKSHAAGLKIAEVPIHWIEDRFPGRHSKVSPIKDSWECIVSLVQIRKSLRFGKSTNNRA